MPELPEVESVRRTLLPRLQGQEIRRVELLFTGAVEVPAAPEFCRALTGRRIIDAERHGKYLAFRLDDQSYLLVHLRMTGRLLVARNETKRPVHLRVAFHFASDRALWFIDVRKFGRVGWFADRKSMEARLKLGPDPLAADFTPTALRSALQGRARVKAALLDQRRIAGLGNIYADEALFLAGIHPMRRLDSLSDAEIEELHQGIQHCLRQAVQHGGTTFRDYVDGDGRAGDYARHLNVYGRKGEPCRVCAATLELIRVAGRSSCFCPTCQRVK